LTNQHFLKQVLSLVKAPNLYHPKPEPRIMIEKVDFSELCMPQVLFSIIQTKNLMLSMFIREAIKRIFEI
jgi:hypothetical protein